jgi:L-fucose mutarotase
MAWKEFRSILAQGGLKIPIEPIQKIAFYEEVDSPDHVLTIQTGDEALWANVLLTMGCRVPDPGN